MFFCNLVARASSREGSRGEGKLSPKPVGFARLFTIVGELVVSPISAKNLDEEYLTLAYEEDCKNQKLDSCLQKTYGNTEHLNEQSLGSISSRY